MATEISIHGVTKIEKEVTVHDAGKPTHFVVVKLIIHSIDVFGNENKTKLVCYVGDKYDDVNIEDILGAEFKLINA